MIAYDEAIRVARSLLGTPYAQLDCINLIKKVIRTAPGGVPNYTTAGTNTLWKSATVAAKYRDLTWRRWENIGARAGMLAFKRSGTDVHHVGLVTDEGTVIHSSSALGKVVETELDEAWTLLATHRYIETKEEKTMNDDVLYLATVDTVKGALRLRELPATNALILEEMPRGAVVEVLERTNDEWRKVRYKGETGYAAEEYLSRVMEDEPTDDEGEVVAEAAVQLVITDEAGNTFRPVGDVHMTLEVVVDGESVD